MRFMRVAGLVEHRRVFKERVLRLWVLDLIRRGVIDTRVTQDDIDYVRELIASGRLDDLPQPDSERDREHD